MEIKHTKSNDISNLSTLEWENVYVFISSTFNDMHAERDFLVKRVFPELSSWCEDRRLRLIDIDLRWGITEEDSEHNKRVVEVCLRNIDKCRPFFLCFLGQRYGWIPDEQNINKETFIEFPLLHDYLGCSVTEMEIRHALLNSMSKDYKETVKHAFFYLRDPDYLENISYAPLRNLFTNEGEDNEKRRLADKKQNSIRENLFQKQYIPQHTPVIEYKADWNTSLKTPELLNKNNSDGLLANGRLCAFRTKKENEPLSDLILNQLKTAITLQYGERKFEHETPLQKELEEQGKLLHVIAEGYINRPSLEKTLDDYILGGDQRPMYIRASAGMGKSSFLANYILNSNRTIIYRFAGISTDSFSSERIAISLLNQLNVDIPSNSKDVLMQFPELLANAIKKSEASPQKPLIIIIDALDQLAGGLACSDFLPKILPKGLKVITTYRSDVLEAKEFTSALKEYAYISEFWGLTEKDEKLMLAKAYLLTYLKELDDKLLEELVGLSGTENPLFLKIILSELRVFGSYDNLAQKINNEYGCNPITAFDSLLKRIENDPAYHNLNPKRLAENMLGLLVHSKDGLSLDEFVKLFIKNNWANCIEDAEDAINYLIRQLRSYLVKRDGRINFFYESFRQACKERYCKTKASQKWHSLIADYFLSLPINAPRRLMELAFQLFYAERLSEYKILISEYLHHDEQIKNFGVEAILEDCKYSSDKSVVLIKDFYYLAGGILKKFPEQLPSQLWGRFHENEDELCDKLIRNASKILSENNQAWLRPKLPFFERPGETSVVREYKSDFPVAGNFTLSPDEQYIVTPSLNKTGGNEFLLWNLNRGSIVRSLSIDDENGIKALFSPDGKYLIGNYSFAGKKIRIWETSSYKAIMDFPDELPCHLTKKENSFYAEHISFAITPDSTSVIAWTHSGLTLFDIQSGEVLFGVPYKYAACSYAFGGNILAVGNLHPDRDNSDYRKPWGRQEYHPICLFSYDSSSCTLTEKSILEGHKSSVVKLDVSQNEKYMASGDQDGIVRLWSIEDEKLIKEIRTDKRGVNSISFSPDSERLMIGGHDGALSFYSIPDMELRRRISCHMGVIMDAAFTPDGTHCFSISNQFTIIKKFSLLTEERIDNSSSERYRSLGKNDKSNLFIASSYMDYVQPYHTPTEGDASGTISFFDADTNRFISNVPLLSHTNTHFPTVTADGSAVVSKNDALENEKNVMISYWPFGDFPVLESEHKCANSFSVKITDKTFCLKNNLHVHFCSDYKYAICTPEIKNEIIVFRVCDGKQISTINWKGQTLQITNSLSGDKNIYEHEERLTDFIFEINDNGKVLYAFNLYTSNLYIYKLGHKGRLSKRVRIKDYKRCSLLSSNFYHTNKLFFKNNTLLVKSEEFVAVIELKKFKLLFQLNKLEKSDYYYGTEYDTHASLHSNGRLLFVSRKLSHAKPDGAEIDDCLEVWDINSGKLVTSFISEGHISNIIVENEHCTFAAGNGELCTLFLENI